MVIAITKADYIDKYKIRVVFSDKKEKVLNFGPFLKTARNPATNKYRDFKKFRKFKLKYGDLCWGDFEMCFPLWKLYEGVYDERIAELS